MECRNCELKQRQFFCERCLRSHLREFRIKTQNTENERDEQIIRATRSLKAADEQRRGRAEHADVQDRVQKLNSALASIRERNERTRELLRSRTATLNTRRRTLATARALPQDPSDTVHSLVVAQQRLTGLSTSLALARQRLVQELVEVFHVVEVGGRPAVGGKAGSKGEWTIGGLVLPVPGDVRRYSPDHMNAVMTHTLHFLNLLTFYLGVKLPFLIEWSSGRLGVGTPWISAIKGGESGSWARWHARNPLHLSTNLNPGTVASSMTASIAVVPNSISPIDSPLSATPTALTPSPPSSFTTAFAMLLYAVAYLAHTQGVEVPLAGVGEVLGNLWAVCCSPALGRRSHATSGGVVAPSAGAAIAALNNVPRVDHTLALSPPTPASFSLDFAQVLQATATGNPKRVIAGTTRVKTHSRSKVRREQVIAEEDGWDLVDADEGDGADFA